MKTDRIIRIDVPQIIKIRKYEVDIEKLKYLLRTSKKQSGLSNKDIANKLDLPLTNVEHWFRTDKYFSIPEADIWFDLKELLNIKDNIFDESIMTFEERLGVYEKSERCYLDIGIAPTITCASADEKIITTYY